MIKHTDAERAVLGSLIIDTAWHWKIPIIKEDYFTSIDYKALFSTIKGLFSSGRTIDTITVNAEQMRLKRDVLTIGECTDEVAHTANFETHLALIKESYISTYIRSVGVKLVEKSAFVEEAVEELDIAFNEVNRTIADGTEDRDWMLILGESMKEAETREKQAKRKEIIGVPSGLLDIDKVTNGWQNSDLIILAGRPSMGKTALALKFARSSQVKTAFFSLEMKDTRLADRLLIAESDVDADKYRSGWLSKNDWQMLEIGAGDLAEVPLIVDEKSSASLGYIRAQIMRKKPKLVIIDYLQLMGIKGYDKNAEFGVITKGLKAIAKQEDIPIILLCQLNRRAEDNVGGVPNLSNLRDSGEIEQDADLVLFVHRPRYYKQDFVTHHNKEIDTKGLMMVMIAKHRNGAIGNIPVRHNESITRFMNFTDMETPF